MTPIRLGACLSLTGKFGRFGAQAARALEAWCRLVDKPVELNVEDDESDPKRLAFVARSLWPTVDLVLGPYSTRLMRTAGEIAADSDLLIWNHGGSGDDVTSAFPGHTISTLSSTKFYADPFVRHYAKLERGPLLIAQGKGAFGRQVCDGAEAACRGLQLDYRRVGPDEPLVVDQNGWALFSAGTFEDDVARVKSALRQTNKPATICSVAAGVTDFADQVDDPTGIYGVGQWAPGLAPRAELGPQEAEFIRAYGCPPDYPAVQAVATAVIATHCLDTATSTDRADLWSAAVALDTSTLFGRFKVDPATGAQLGHRGALVQWRDDGPHVVKD